MLAMGSDRISLTKNEQIQPSDLRGFCHCMKACLALSLLADYLLYWFLLRDICCPSKQT